MICRRLDWAGRARRPLVPGADDPLDDPGAPMVSVMWFLPDGKPCSGTPPNARKGAKSSVVELVGKSVRPERRRPVARGGPSADADRRWAVGGWWMVSHISLGPGPHVPDLGGEILR